MVGEGGDEGGVEIVLGEVLFVISEEDRGDGGKVIVLLGKGLDRHVSREVGWGRRPSPVLRKDPLVEWRERNPERTWRNDGGVEGEVVQRGVRLEMAAA